MNSLRNEPTLNGLHEKSDAAIADDLSYSEVEASGPPAAPLGFPAPHVMSLEIVKVLCFDKNKSVWTEVNAILHPKHGEEGHKAEVAYMLTSQVLKQTICGRVIKGMVLRRSDNAMVANRSNRYEYSSNFSAHQGNLWEMTDEYVAIKVDRREQMEKIHGKSIQRNPENPWKEVAAMQLLGNNHPNVMGLFGAFVDKKSLYEVMRFCSKGTISALIHSHPSGLSEHIAQEIFTQVLSGLQYIHSHGVCHHDISTDNIMLDEDGRCVIIDFGMCLRLPYSYPDDPTGYTDDTTDISVGTTRRLIHCQNFCGKLRFVSPEIYQRRVGIDGFASDIWSLGVVLFVILTGRQPYGKPDLKDPGYYDLVDPQYYWNIDKTDAILTWGRHISHEAVDLLRGMLCPDPRNRSTLGSIMKHKWLDKDQSKLDEHLTIIQ